MGVSLGSMVYMISANNSRLRSTVADSRRQIRSLDNQVESSAKKMQNFGKSMTKYVTLPMTILTGIVSKFGMDFEDAMTQSTAIMGDVSNKMRKQMEDTARQVALTTDKSATQAAQSYYYLASAGLDVAQSIKALPEVAKFATAGQFDMARATDLLTDAQSALGLTVKDSTQNMENMAEVSDVLVKANTLANASVQQFSEALTTKAGAAIKTANKSIEEGVAVLAAFADQGLKGAAAGEQFSIAMRYLQQAALNNKKDLQKYNVAVFDSSGKMRNMADIVASLEKALKGMSDEQKAAALKAMGFNARIQNTIKLLLGSSDKIRNYQKQLEKAGGITDKVANKQMQSMKKQLGLIKDALIDATLSLYDFAKPTIAEEVVPSLQKFSKWLRNVSKDFENLDPKVQKLIGTILLLTTTAGPAVYILGKLSSLVELITASNLAFAFQAWATGAATATEAVGFLAGSFNPFLVGGAILIGLASIYKYFVDIRKEASGLDTDISKLNLKQAQSELYKTQDRINQLKTQFKKDGIDLNVYNRESVFKKAGFSRLNQLPPIMQQTIKEYYQQLDKAKELQEKINKMKEKNKKLNNSGSDSSSNSNSISPATAADTSYYDKTIAAMERKMKMQGVSLEKQIQTYQDIQSKLQSAMRGIDQGVVSEDYVKKRLGMGTRDIKKALSDTEVKLYQLREKQAKKYYDNVMKRDKELLKYKKVNINTILNEYKRMYNSIEKDDRLSLNTRKQLKEQYDAEIKRLEYQKQTNIKNLNQKLFDKQKQLIDDGLNVKLMSLNAEEKAIKEAYKNQIKDQNKLKEKLQEVSDIYNQLRENAVKDYDKKHTTYDELDSLSKLFYQITGNIKSAQSAATNFTNNLEDGLTNAIVQGKSLTDVFKNLLKQIEAMVVKQGIVQPIVSGIGSFVGSMFTAHTGGYIAADGIDTFHVGGVVGLKPDERLVKTRIGELILNKDQQGNLASNMNQSQQSQPTTANIFNITAMDSQDVIRALTKNDALSTAFAMDMSKNGKTRQVIKQYNK